MLGFLRINVGFSRWIIGGVVGCLFGGVVKDMVRYEFVRIWDRR